MKIKELCQDERPREKLLSKGPAAMSNAELLAILIGSGTRGENVLEVANRLLSKGEGHLGGIASMDKDAMMAVNGIGESRFASISAALELGKRCCLESPSLERSPINTPAQIFRMMLPRLRGLDHEEFWVFFLNSANFIIHKELVSTGGLTSIMVDPKIVVRKALDKKSTRLVLVHNHPSGNPRPGVEDIKQTKRMRDAAATFDISVLDHIIVCDDRFFSFSDEDVFIDNRAMAPANNGRIFG